MKHTLGWLLSLFISVVMVSMTVTSSAQAQSCVGTSPVYCAGSCNVWSSECTCTSQMCTTFYPLPQYGCTATNASGESCSVAVTSRDVHNNPTSCASGGCQLCTTTNDKFTCPGYLNPCMVVCDDPGGPAPSSPPPSNPPPNPAPTCSILIDGKTGSNRLTSVEAQTVTLTLQGNANDAAARPVRLVLARRDGAALTGYGSPITYNNINYYVLTSCNSSNSLCTSTTTRTFPAGEYFLECDIDTGNTADRCSGNPWCSYNYSTIDNDIKPLPGSYVCNNWASCSEEDIKYLNVEPQDCNDSTIAGPTSLFLGQTGSYSVNFPIVRGTLNNVTFSSSSPSNVSLSPASVASPGPYTTTGTSANLGTSNISANGIMNGTARCTTTPLTVTVSRPTTTIQANAYRAANDRSCTGTSTNFNGDTTFVGQFWLSGPGSYSQRRNFSSSVTSASFSPVNGSYPSNPYTLSVDPFPPSPWVLLSCSPLSRSITLGNYPLQASYSYNYYFAYRSGSWWQVIGGDVYAQGSMSSVIPPSPTSTYTRFLNHLSNVDNPPTSGAAIAGSTVGITGSFAPANRAWEVENSTFSTHQQDGYQYFKDNFQLGETPNESFSTNDLIWGTSSPAKTYADGSSAYFHEGNLTIFNPENYVGKSTVFVHGDLLINNNVTVDAPNFLSFIVDGNIVIAGNVTQVEGVYIADNITDLTKGKIIVRDSDLTLSNQLVAEGVFVGWNGVTFERRLNGNQGLDNNDKPTEQFFYRGDFITNAPEGFKRSGVEWQEITPSGSTTEPTPTPTATPLGSVCTGTPPVCVYGSYCDNGTYRCKTSGGTEL